MECFLAVLTLGMVATGPSGRGSQRGTGSGSRGSGNGGRGSGGDLPAPLPVGVVQKNQPALHLRGDAPTPMEVDSKGTGRG